MTRPRMKSALEIVLELIPRLNEDELEEVSKNIKALGQFHRKSNIDIHDDYLLQGILYEVEWLGLSETIPPFFKIKNAKSFNAYSKNAEQVRSMLDRHLPDLTLPDKLLLGRLCARLLREYMESWCVPDFTSILSNVSKIPRVLENAYPGYIRNGALPYVLRALTAPEAWNHYEFDDC